MEKRLCILHDALVCMACRSLRSVWKAWIIQAPQHRCTSKRPQALDWTLMLCMRPQQLLPSSSSRAAFSGAWTPSLPPLPSSPVSWATPMQLLQHRTLASQVCLQTTSRAR